MKPLFSDEERAQANKNFIVARYHHKAKINNFYSVESYLNDDLIRPLNKLNRTGDKVAVYDSKGSFVRYENRYSSHDAEVYFEWLVAVVSGAEPADEEIIKQANNQLFQLLHVMESDIEIEKNVQLLAPHDWQNLFLSFDRELIDIKNTVDRHDKEIGNILKSILEFLKKNATL